MCVFSNEHLIGYSGRDSPWVDAVDVGRVLLLDDSSGQPDYEISARVEKKGGQLTRRDIIGCCVH